MPKFDKKLEYHHDSPVYRDWLFAVGEPLELKPDLPSSQLHAYPVYSGKRRVSARFSRLEFLEKTDQPGN